MILPLLALTLIGCAHAPTAAIHHAPDYDKVLVVENTASEASKEIGGYYVKARDIPSAHVLTISSSTDDDISWTDYVSKILKPVEAKLQGLPDIKYIVLTKGVPLRISEGGFSVDGELELAGNPVDEVQKANGNQQSGPPNPYFDKDERFSHAKYGFYLVTRLDGYTVDDVKKLIDNSINPKREKGPFFFDTGASPGGGGYAHMHRTLVNASAVLTAKGLNAETDQTAEFKAPEEPLAGYASWGSNDQHYSADNYHKLRFKPGALAETFVSTSGRTFTHVTGGQSLIADLIAQGITGVSGHVSEPYTSGLIRPDVLFERYTSGSNLAESFYMASPMLKWKEVIIGDPLCSPYGKK